MKSLLLIICLLLTGVVFAEGPIYDPSRVSTKPLTCTVQLARTNEVPMDVVEVSSINFYRSNYSAGPWTLIGQTIGANCMWIEYINILAEVQYYYHVTATDWYGISSDMSNIIAMEVRTIAPPKPPIGLGWAD